MEFDAVEKALQQKIGNKATKATVQKVLSKCKAGDLHPLPLIGRWKKERSPTPLGIIVDACRNPDRYLDCIGGWGKFIEEVYKSPSEQKTGGDSDPTSIADIMKNVMLGGT